MTGSGHTHVQGAGAGAPRANDARTWQWRAIEADDHLRRHAPDPGFDDSAWTPIDVPGHWVDHPELATSTGPILYRARLHNPSPSSEASSEPSSDRCEIDVADEADRRWFLRFEGVHYQSDVWMDGTYLGDTEGGEVPHVFEVGDLLASRSEHLLTVEVSSPPAGDFRHQRHPLGLLGQDDLLAPGPPPGGIWRPVRLECSGPVRLVSTTVACADATPTEALIRVAAVLDSDRSGATTLVTTVEGAGTRVRLETEHTLSVGVNRVEWRVAVPDPPLWWPHSLGEQPMVDVEVIALVDGRRSDVARRRTGLRTVSLHDWRCTINGIPRFLMGAALTPFDHLPGHTDPEQVTRTLTAARDAGLDLLRVTGHVAVPEVYEAADRLGLLLWQDLPLRGAYHRGVRRAAVRQARDITTELMHHPSVAWWCAHDLPRPLEPATDAPHGHGRRPLRIRSILAAHLPSADTTLTDPAVSRAVAAIDPTRTVIRHSGRPPRLWSLHPTDTRASESWSTPGRPGIATRLRRRPALGRFVTGLGSRSLPDSPAGDHPTNDRSAAEARARHARVLREQIEALRLIKYRPCGGFVIDQLTDATVRASGALLGPGPDRTPKPAFEAVRLACRPVLPIIEGLPEAVPAGTPLQLDLHLANERTTPIEEITATTVVTGPGLERRWTHRGRVDADAVTHIAGIAVVAPRRPGPLQITVTATWPTESVGHRSGRPESVTATYEVEVEGFGTAGATGSGG